MLSIGKFLGATLNIGEDSRRGVRQGLGFALALVEQLLLVGFEGFMDFFTFGDYIGEKIFPVGKLALQFF